MELEDRYYELQDISETIEDLIGRIKDEIIILDLRNIQIYADDEIKEIKPILDEKYQDEYDRELRERENEYWRDVV